ncbi:rRNA maturation RNase YbeY [bacterium]|jgi:probable rRNA maturation factor|nr:rRNA maturation RNase YbeY [bacterium]
MEKNKPIIRVNSLYSLPLDFDVSEFLNDILIHLAIDTGEFEFTIVGKELIKEINQTHLERDEFTDVITFNLGTSEYIEGDVYICGEVAEEQSIKFNQSISDEMALLLIHGVLHLMGYEDETPEKKKEMFEIQDKVFDRFRRATIGS